MTDLTQHLAFEAGFRHDLAHRKEAAEEKWLCCFVYFSVLVFNFQAPTGNLDSGKVLCECLFPCILMLLVGQKPCFVALFQLS